MDAAAPAAVVTRGLTRRFGKIVAVDHLDLTVRTGELYGFLGPNGAGKSTTLRMLCGILEPSEGGGHVLGIDLAEPLLEQASAKAAAERLPNIEFRRGNAISTGLPAASFDAVVCVFGVFFAPDMAGFAAEMWRLVRPGGVLAITTWGPGLFEPANAIFWESVRGLAPSLYESFNSWDEITTPDALAALYARAGVPEAEVEAVPARQDLTSPARFWDVVLGSEYRATVDALDQDQQDVLREDVLTKLSSRGISTLRTDVVFGRAIRRTE